MKIQKLHIYNIASIEDQTIDFTQEPLSNSDVFLITGNMGSGKTTILDAICLALYNTTPRLVNRGKTTVANSIDELALNDPRRLMRRNTGEAYVELYFEGINNDNYLAVWQVQRGSTKKPSNLLDRSTWSLTNLTNNVTVSCVGTRTSEVKSAMLQAVGLDFDQFCRTTMLAQGEFTRFLKSDEKEKAEILEKLTQFSDYTAAGKLIYEITKEKQKAKDDADEKAKDTGLTDEQRKEKEDSLKGLNESSSKLSTESETVTAKGLWLKTENDFNEKIANADTALKEVQEQLNSDAYKTNQALVEDWSNSIEVRANLTNQLQAEDNERKAKYELSKLESAYCNVIAGLNEATQKQQATDKKHQDVGKELDRQKDKQCVYEQAQTIVGQLQNLHKAETDIADNNSKILQEEQNRDNTLVPAQQAAEKAFDTANKELDEISKNISAREQTLNELNLADLRKEVEDLRVLLVNISVAKNDLQAIAEEKSKHKQDADNLKKMQSHLKEISDKQKELDDEFEKAKNDYERCERELELMKDSVDSFAKQMRTKLTQGCTCPVCQQAVNALPNESELDNVFKEATQKRDEAKRIKKEKEEEKNTNQATITAETERYDNDLKRFNNDKSVENATQQTLASCEKCGINTIDDTTSFELSTSSVLSTLENNTKAKLDNELQPKIKEGEDLEKELVNLRGEHQKQLNEVENKRTAFSNAKEAVTACNNRINGYQQVIEAKKADKETAKGNISKALGSTTWDISWEEKPLVFAKALTDSADAYNNLKNNKEKYSTLLEKLTNTVEQTQEVVNKISDANASWKELVVNNVQALPDLVQAANKVLTELSLANQSLSQAQSIIEENRQKVEKFLGQHPDINLDRLKALNEYDTTYIETLRGNLATLLQKESAAKQSLVDATDEHSKHQKQKPVFQEDETIESLRDRLKAIQEENKKLNQQIGSIKEELRIDDEKKNNVVNLQQLAKEADAIYQKWDRLNKLFGDAEGSKFQRIAQSYILDGLLNSANHYLERLEPRYTLRAVPGTLHISLEDAYQGFATRSTDSLSGGEGFLVSLALALALADIGQSLAVDTLFIDEGFGTLSGIPLSNAINTLRSLHGQSGRHVGIISHIQEVRENIPVQIQVIQSENQSSSTITIVP